MMRSVKMEKLPFALAVLLLLCTSGCASLMVRPLLDPMTASLEKQRDVRLVRDGLPGLLLMIDGLLEGNPRDPHLLAMGTRAYSSYALLLKEYGEDDRAKALSGKARDYGLALLDGLPGMAAGLAKALPEFDQALAGLSRDDVSSLFWGGYGWATWIGFQEGSPASLADLTKVERIMLRVVELDESFFYGGAHLFLGAYYGARPTMLGGQLQTSEQHFERALALGNREFLMAQVLYAETYCRMVLDRDLFERLLTEVMKRPADSKPELSLMNQVAKLRARKLLNQTETFF